MSEITSAYAKQLDKAVSKGQMSEELRAGIFEKLVTFTKGYPYLLEG
jgi:hypothetical protein